MRASHHSHSGEFCGHAKDKLEDVVRAAMKDGMQVFAMTEHMPREEQDLYPGEIERKTTSPYLDELYARFYSEARRLQDKYAGSIKLLVGMEIDWIRASTQALVEALLSRYQLDLFVGSVHHVHGIPIDYNQELYDEAVKVSASQGATSDAASGSLSAEEMLFADYFDAQLAMLQALRPPVVGHFDLIRLYSADPNRPWEQTGVWDRIERNLEFVKEYGGLLEVNSSAVRKGLKEPYPQSGIVKRFNELGGEFVLSDDSHGIEQIGACYDETLAHITSCGVRMLAAFARGKTTRDERFPNISIHRVPIDLVI